MTLPRRPHVIIFNPDQWRGDVLGCHGNGAARTPNIDKLVTEDAVSFRSAFCQNPICTPSRCSFMSGWYSHVRGHRTLYHMMQPDEPVLLKTLKDNGYYVWWGGKNDLVPAQLGFDRYCHERYDVRSAERTVQPMFAIDREAEWRGGPESDSFYSFYTGRLPSPAGEPYFDQDWANVFGAVDTIRKWGARADESGAQPLCIFLPLTYPHPPYAVEDPWYSSIDRTLLPPRISGTGTGKAGMLHGIRRRQRLQDWPEARWDELRATYYGMCARVDHQFGLILEALRDAGMYDDSAIFLFSDHGDYTGDYDVVEKSQNTFEDCLVRVPFVVKPPASVPVRPGVSSALVELVDFPATVEDLVGIQPEHTHFGRSLLPLLTGESASHRDAVFCEGGRLSGEREAMELESGLGLTPQSLYWPRLSMQFDDDVAHTKATMCRTADMKYVRRLYEPDELYDLRTDPGELRNLADDPGFREVRAAMIDRMLAWYQQTVDVVPRRPDLRE